MLNSIPFNTPAPEPNKQGGQQQLMAQLLMGGLPGALQGKKGLAGLMPSDPLIGMLAGGGKKGLF